jgi:uncharacterized OB-fold protein
MTLNPEPAAIGHAQLVPQLGEVPDPVPSRTSQPFWDGCAEGKLLYQECRACGTVTHPPAVLCPNCLSTRLEWHASSGRGRVYSYTLVWRPQTPAFSVPYAPVIVDMDEGWQMLAAVVDCTIDALHVGMDVEVTFHPTAGGTMLAYFRPA